MKPIRIGFNIRTHPDMTPEEFFKDMPYVLEHFNFEYRKDDPDYAICYHQNEMMPAGEFTRIFYCQEVLRPNMNLWDYGLVWEYSDVLEYPERCLRFPDYVKYGAREDLIKPSSYNPKEILEKKTKFCAFIYNHHVSFCDLFFKQLCSYKRVDSPGTVRNNMVPMHGHKTTKDARYTSNWCQEKIEFLKPYKFVICFEHSLFPGYTSEKLYHAMLANCIPIYWGNPLVHRDFNTKSFINAHDFPVESKDDLYSQLIQFIQAIDTKPNLYLQMLSEPWYNNNELNEFVNPKNVISFFEKIFSKEL